LTIGIADEGSNRNIVERVVGELRQRVANVSRPSASSCSVLREISPLRLELGRLLAMSVS